LTEINIKCNKPNCWCRRGKDLDAGKNVRLPQQGDLDDKYRLVPQGSYRLKNKAFKACRPKERTKENDEKG